MDDPSLTRPCNNRAPPRPSASLELIFRRPGSPERGQPARGPGAAGQLLPPRSTTTTTPATPRGPAFRQVRPRGLWDPTRKTRSPRPRQPAPPSDPKQGSTPHFNHRRALPGRRPAEHRPGSPQGQPRSSSRQAPDFRAGATWGCPDFGEGIFHPPPPSLAQGQGVLQRPSKARRPPRQCRNPEQIRHQAWRPRGLHRQHGQVRPRLRSSWTVRPADRGPSGAAPGRARPPVRLGTTFRSTTWTPPVSPAGALVSAGSRPSATGAEEESAESWAADNSFTLPPRPWSHLLTEAHRRSPRATGPRSPDQIPEWFEGPVPPRRPQRRRRPPEPSGVAPFSG